MAIKDESYTTNKKRFGTSVLNEYDDGVGKARRWEYPNIAVV